MLFVEQKYNFHKNKTELKMENSTDSIREIWSSASAHIKITN